MENISEEISDINMKENKNDVKLLQNKTKSEHNIIKIKIKKVMRRKYYKRKKRRNKF